MERDDIIVGSKVRVVGYDPEIDGHYGEVIVNDPSSGFVEVVLPNAPKNMGSTIWLLFANELEPAQ